jgi:hypothetical protein
MGREKGSPASRATIWRTELVPAVGGVAWDGPAGVCASVSRDAASNGAAAAARAKCLRLSLTAMGALPILFV